MRTRSLRLPAHLAVALATFLMLTAPALSSQRRYLSDSKLILISGISVATFAGSELLGKIDSSRTSRIPRPILNDTWIQRHWGGRWYVGKNNFFSKGIGSISVQAVSGALVMYVDHRWPQDNRFRDTKQDFVLFISGLIFTEGVTNFAKYTFARPRPFLTLEPTLAAQRTNINYDDDHRSFFSGHTSSAFFAATYANKRLRMAMRDRLSPEQYRHWRWAPPIGLYGLATVVAWGRISTYDHYFSDVTVGAAVGYALGELFFRMGEPGRLKWLQMGGSARSITLCVSF